MCLNDPCTKELASEIIKRFKYTLLDHAPDSSSTRSWILVDFENLDLLTALAPGIRPLSNRLLHDMISQPQSLTKPSDYYVNMYSQKEQFFHQQRLQAPPLQMDSPITRTPELEEESDPSPLEAKPELQFNLQSQPISLLTSQTSSVFTQPTQSSEESATNYSEPVHIHIQSRIMEYMETWFQPRQGITQVDPTDPDTFTLTGELPEDAQYYHHYPAHSPLLVIGATTITDEYRDGFNTQMITIYSKLLVDHSKNLPQLISIAILLLI